MSSGFITETEIEDKRKLRQEEWEKVRKPEDPVEAPEEQYDPRSLYERLQEQKTKKDVEYEEAHKLKNMIKGLDDDEVDFLDLVDRSKMEAERRMYAEEAQEMEDFRSAVASLQERNLQERIIQEVKRQPQSTNAASGSGSKGSQQKLLLSGAVKRKNTDSTGAPESKKSTTELVSTETKESNGLEKRKRSEEDEPTEAEGTMKCIGILPGIGQYHDSSDSEHSSNTDEELCTVVGFDLRGRRIGKSCKQKVAR